MILYKLINDCVILLHLLWIVFILFGFVAALRYFKVAFLHMAGLVFTLILNLGGWYCPLTYLENYLHGLYEPQSPHTGSFIANNLERLIYLEVDVVYLRVGAILWVGLNMVGYALWLRKKLLRYRAQP